ncbi:MAG: F0F1 ATP synthase subunit gamma [Clostridia bacterium]|nr:F0F1 ATP synthase subunit gamma [Clostridia bacterium]
MPAIQVLKKKLRGIQSTQKISKAMKTISSIKISQLTTAYNNYNEYGSQCEKLYEEYKNDLLGVLPPMNETAPVCYIIIASNKGLCGGFNSDLLKFAVEEIEKTKKEHILIAVGKQAITYFNNKHKDYEKSFVFGDIPDYNNANELLNYIIELRKTQKISSVKVIYQKYSNMMKQTPYIQELFCGDEINQSEGKTVLMPDKQMVIKNIAPVVFQSIFYKLLLEVALGANASTLMTMRSAYDTATEYCEQLEREINRQRQSAVTADVLETASEFTD